MKYALVIPDGAADRPIPDLHNQTPLEAAEMPALTRLASMGQMGTVRTTPPGQQAGSDICCMTLLGYDPARYHTGRAPLEAGAMGLNPAPSDWIFRLNLVTTTDEGPTVPGRPEGLMLDHSAGAVTDAEARALLSDLSRYWAETEPELAGQFTLHPGVGYRNILIDRSGRDYRPAGPADLSGTNPAGFTHTERLQTFPPHEIPKKPWRRFLPRGPHADILTRLMERSRECFSAHEINRTRKSVGLRPATMAWIWGQGTAPSMPAFGERYGVRGGITTAVDLLAGIASFTGLERIPVPGLTSYHDNDYEAQGRYSIAALERCDLIVIHVESPDEAAHQGDWQTKVEALGAIDRHIIAPLAREMESRWGRPGGGGWRMLVAPDHYTLCDTLKHDPTPPPFLLVGTGVRAMGRAPFCEAQALAAALHIEPGDALMEHFLWGGLKRPETAAER